jgi:hypothetical protein
MVLNVRQVQRAHFLGLLDISWTHVSLGKTFLARISCFYCSLRWSICFPPSSLEP